MDFSLKYWLKAPYYAIRYGEWEFGFWDKFCNSQPEPIYGNINLDFYDGWWCSVRLWRWYISVHFW